MLPLHIFLQMRIYMYIYIIVKPSALFNYIYVNLHGITVLHTGKHGYTIYNWSQIYDCVKIYIKYT